MIVTINGVLMDVIQSKDKKTGDLRLTGLVYQKGQKTLAMFRFPAEQEKIPAVGSEFCGSGLLISWSGRDGIQHMVLGDK